MFDAKVFDLAAKDLPARAEAGDKLEWKKRVVLVRLIYKRARMGEMRKEMCTYDELLVTLTNLPVRDLCRNDGRL